MKEIKEKLIYILEIKWYYPFIYSYVFNLLAFSSLLLIDYLGPCSKSLESTLSWFLFVVNILLLLLLMSSFIYQIIKKKWWRAFFVTLYSLMHGSMSAFNIFLLLTMGLITTCNRGCETNNDCSVFGEKTYINMKVDTAYLNEKGNLQLIIDTESLDTLPDNYFLDSSITNSLHCEIGCDDYGNINRINTLALTRNKISCIVNSPPVVPTDAILSFYFSLPDRRHYLPCSHIGMDDEYKIRITFEWMNGEIQSFSWHELNILGAL
jgi:hypothetical protein